MERIKPLDGLFPDDYCLFMEVVFGIGLVLVLCPILMAITFALVCAVFDIIEKSPLKMLLVVLAAALFLQSG